MPDRTSTRRPRDPNQLAKMIVDLASGDQTPSAEGSAAPLKKNPAAVALGRLGGRKGGPARAESLSSEQRVEIARKAAAKRWGKSR
jgi:hypothetical protein